MAENLRKEIDLYLQELLKLQYLASNNISHRGTKGELREKFIKQVVSSEYANIIVKSGVLADEDWQSTQADFLWLKPHARVGGMDIYDLEDCFCLWRSKAMQHAKNLEI